MRTLKTLMMVAVVVSICGVMLTGCASSRRHDRTDERLDTRDNRKDVRKD